MTVTVNIHEAKAHLSRLVDQADKGQEFVIAKAGKPVVRVVPINSVSPLRSLGFLAGQGIVACDVKKVFASDIETMFNAPG